MTKRSDAIDRNGWDNHYAALAGKEPRYQQPVPEHRVRKPNKAPSAEPSEAQILKAILSLLKRHPKVARVWRQNSGTFQVGERYVRANTARGMSDIAGVLKSGRSLFVEVKAAKGAVMEYQQQFLDDMTKAGALAFVARSVDEVVKRLEAA